MHVGPSCYTMKLYISIIFHYHLHHICRNPNFGLATKAKGLTTVRAKTRPRSHITYSWECKKVWGSEPSHSQGNSHFGRWSPGGLPTFQRVISGVKTQWLMTFFISLESSWNLDVLNGLSLLIWTSETQFMAKRRPGSQTANLTPDQKKSRIDPIYLVSDNVQHTVGKLSTRTTTLF